MSVHSGSLIGVSTSMVYMTVAYVTSCLNLYDISATYKVLMLTEAELILSALRYPTLNTSGLTSAQPMSCLQSIQNNLKQRGLSQPERALSSRLQNQKLYTESSLEDQLKQIIDHQFVTHNVTLSYWFCHFQIPFFQETFSQLQLFFANQFNFSLLDDLGKWYLQQQGLTVRL